MDLEVFKITATGDEVHEVHRNDHMAARRQPEDLV
jgi:hypothetical protein